YHTYVHENIKRFLEGFRYDAHPMSMLCSSVAALSSFYPEAKSIKDPEQRYISIIRLLAKMPTLAAFIYRHGKGLPFIYPDNDLGYVENFLSMVARMSEPQYEANPVFVKALEVLFILHADHEQNCSTNAVRAVGSSEVDPFSAIAAGIAALYGPLHGGYFVSRKLYPNVDFYTGLIYRSMAFPTDFFTVLFAVARTAGWLAQWEELLNDKEQKIARPRQIYIGYGEREYESRLNEKFPKTNKDGRKR